ncbi:MAG: hypothetical protein CVV44_09060 [Spirochaetae bacterium HGW-Spirochaetae-1]|jgi:tetratricopeptide (TPR) repeat protein|nr:MAG: hypothetical protein CVV44_09060 [Spirochaetae bacterium HGW-Spirochaetae-1]
MIKRKRSLLFLLLTGIFMMLLGAAAFSAEDPQTMNKRGVDLGKKKMYKEAIGEFDRAIEKYDKDSAMAFHNKAWSYELAGNVKEAIVNYEEALRRLPSQTLSGEKLGFIYYKTGDYINAVRIGELVLKYDPDNKEVLKWLTDAYMKKLQQEREMRKGQEKETVKDTLEKEKEPKKKREETPIIVATLDFMIRTGYYFAGNKGYRYVADEGAILNVPETLFVRFTPIKAWEFTFIAENPYLGALTPPEIITQQETLESLYRLGNFMLGLGFIFSQHESSNLSFGMNLKEWDFKTGFLFGYTKEKMRFDIRFYPRFLPHDGEASKGQTLDFDMLDWRFTYTVDKTLKYYTIMSFKDYYLFNHSAATPISDYWGVYDIGLGVTLGNISPANDSFAWALTIEYRQRFYLRDLGNEDPYSMAPNGQGWFGMNKDKWASGSPFSGYRAIGSELSVRVDEQVLPYLFLYQKFIIEMGDLSEDHHEINFQIGVGGMY